MNIALQTQMKAASSPSFTPIHIGLLQRKCASDGCAERRKKQMTLQRSSTNQAEPSEVPPIVHEVLRSPSEPLDTDTRAFMELRFGHDFSQVRVHADAKAAESARAVNALGYTVGKEVVFGAEQYVPTTAKGRQLLAHELTHVVQQGGWSGDIERMQGQQILSSSGDAAEREADKTSASISAGEYIKRSHQRIPVQIQRYIPPMERYDPYSRCPTSVKLGNVRQYNHSTISARNKETYRTYLSAIATMDVGPGPDHRGHCMQEILIPISNSCPAALTKTTAPCSAHDCIPIDKPTSFVDGHVSKSNRSVLEGTGINSCSVICEQRYFCDSLAGPPATGVFQIRRDYQAGTYTKADGTTVHITTGTVTKTEAPRSPSQLPGIPKTAPPKPQEPPVRTLPEGMELA